MPASPILIVTRPAPDGQSFAAAVEKALGEPGYTILSPAFTIAPCAAEPPPDYAALIFTSGNGVAQAVRLGARSVPAFCVGDRTADRARAAGFDATSAGGDADALVAHLMNIRPTTPLVHVTGAERRGAVAERLTEAGMPCQTVVAYRQDPMGPTPALDAAAGGTRPVVVPVFSPRSALPILALDWHAPLHVVAMSAAVAEATAGVHPDTMTISEEPTGNGMCDKTLMVLRGLLDRGVRLEGRGAAG